MRISDWSSDVCASDLTLGEALDVRDYTTEASIGPESSLEGTTVAAFKADLEDVELTGLERDGEHRKKVAGQTLIKDGDTLMLKGQPHALERAIAAHGLLLAGQHREGITKTHSAEWGRVRAVGPAADNVVGGQGGRREVQDRYGHN